MQPPFQQLSRQQAKDYLQQFVAELPGSRDRLARMLSDAGADPSLAHEPSAAGLDAVWDAAGRWDLGWQQGYTPPPHPAAPPVSQPTLEALGPLEELPSWFVHDRVQTMRLSPATLWAVDVLARHLGEVVLVEHPRLQWTLGPAKPANNVDRNYPVVGTSKAWVNPLRVVSGLVTRRIQGDLDGPGPSSLGELYERQTARVEEW